MKKLFLGGLCVLLSFAGIANSLLGTKTTGDLSGSYNGMELISNGTDVALVLAENSSGFLYVIDIADNNVGDAAVNRVTSIPNFETSVKSTLGLSAITMLDIQINPISKAVYVLADGGGATHVVVVTGDGTTFQKFDLTNVDYAAVKFSGSAYNVQDLTWGDNTLFISSGSFSLAGEIGMKTAPFNNNDTTTNRNTTMYKTNWGNNYFTTAPLEKWDYVNINNEHRLVGVTICAPGFSFETSAIGQSGIFQVEEHFNVRYSPPTKVIHIDHDTLSYLFDLHQSGGAKKLYRLGEKWFDGSRITANEYNSTVKHLRETNGQPTTGMGEEEIKMYDDTLRMIAFFDNWNLVVHDNHDVLRMMEVGEEPQQPNGIDPVKQFNFSVSPNPTQGLVTLKSEAFTQGKNTILVYDIYGKIVKRQNAINSSNQTLDLTDLSPAPYFVAVQTGDFISAKTQIILQ